MKGKGNPWVGFFFFFSFCWQWEGDSDAGQCIPCRYCYTDVHFPLQLPASAPACRGDPEGLRPWWHLTGAPGSPRRIWDSRSLPKPQWQEPQLSWSQQGPGAGCLQLQAAGAGGAVSLLPSLPRLAAVSRKSFQPCFSLLSCKVNVSAFYLSDPFFYVIL